MFKETLDRIGQFLALKKNKTHYADCVIRDEKGRICLLHRSYQDDFAPGKWCLPGGHIEDGEEPIIAAGRELEEETGYKDVPLFYLDKVDRKDSVSLYYEGFVYSGTAVLLDNDEHYRIQWVEPKDLDDYELLLDLKDTLAKLPLSPVPTLPEVAPIGEDLYTSWQNNLTSFDEGKIDEPTFFKTVEVHKAVAAYELVTRAFDNDEITPEEFSRIHKVEKAEGFDQILELAKGTDTEVLEEIVKSAMIGEVHHWKDGDYKKNSGGEWIKEENQLPSSDEEAKAKAKTLLKDIGDGIKIDFSGYSNTNGKSVYFKAYKGDKEVKVRVSDHSVTNKDRVFDEVHLSFTSKKSQIEQALNKIKYELGVEGYKYGKTKIEMPSGRVVDAFGYYKEEKVEKMDTGSTPGFETVTENGKLVKGEDKETTKADHTKWL